MLKEKIIVVTGGGGYLGRDFCTAIAEQGGIPIVADLNFDSAAKISGEILANHLGRAEPISLNITKKSSVSDLISYLDEKYGHIDAVVNNAYPRNGNYGRKLEDVTYEDFCENIDLHLGGYFLVMQQFGLYFRKQGYGNIVNLSSIYGVIPPRFEIYQNTVMTMPVEYAAIKSAVVHLTKYFAQYFKRDGIRVNCVSPGGILDNQPDSFLASYKAHCGKKGMLHPGDVTGSLLFLLSDHSQYVTGQDLIVDDGFSL